MTEYIIECDYNVDDGLIPGEVREEVVRCRDCKHSNEVTWPAYYQVPPDYLDCGGPLVETWDYWNDEPKDNPVPPDGFCFYGERLETCHCVDVNGYSYRFECSACGYVAIVHNCETRLDELPNYCPNCGARVVE